MKLPRAVAAAVAVSVLGASLGARAQGVSAQAASSNSISPSATWYCEFTNSPTDCGLSLQAAASNRAAIVGPGVDSATAVELTTQPGDSNLFGSGTAERADLSLGPASSYCNQGQEEWWAHSVMFSTSYVVPPAGAVWNWGVVFDFHHTGPTGQPNFQIASLPTGLELWVSGGPTVVNGPTDPGFYRVAIGPVTKNAWYNFMYHIKWSSGSDGLFQAWLNGQQVMNYNGANLYVGESCYLKLANYHTPLGVAVSVIHSRVVLGATQADVEIPSSGSPPPPPPVSVTVAPATATVQSGASQTLTATVTNTTNTAVTWQVNGVVGGNGTVGTITASGGYTAPSTVPSPATVTVTAVSVADPTRTGSAQVTIRAAAPPPPPPVSVSVAPGTASLQAGVTQDFTATVTNTTNVTVTWQVDGVTGGDATVGVISTSGVYSAPSMVPSPATVTVTAVSAADPTRSGSAQVTILTPSNAGPPGPPPAADTSGGAGGGGSVDSLTLIACALALAYACRRRGVQGARSHAAPWRAGTAKFR